VTMQAQRPCSSNNAVLVIWVLHLNTAVSAKCSRAAPPPPRASKLLAGSHCLRGLPLPLLTLLLRLNRMLPLS
jgi:hypothetical protein